jgi:NTP pyrophosphatase (non-canonical NTP hydrolase)
MSTEKAPNHEDPSPIDMTLRELGAWGMVFAKKLAAKHGLETPQDPLLAFMQLAKVHQEVSEIGDEMHREAGHTFAVKDGTYDRENEGKEFADGMLALAVLAAMRQVNLAEVTMAKMQEIDDRPL